MIETSCLYQQLSAGERARHWRAWNAILIAGFPRDFIRAPNSCGMTRREELHVSSNLLGSVFADFLGFLVVFLKLINALVHFSPLRQSWFHRKRQLNEMIAICLP